MPIRSKLIDAPLCILIASTLIGCFCLPTLGQGPGSDGKDYTVEDLLPETISDPLEPVNRTIGIVNHGLIMGVIRPTSSVYRFVVCPPLRKGVSNFGHNLAFPVRLMNNLLQGQWDGAGIESKRFVLNSTFGVGGLFDLASRDGIGKSEEDFQDTLASWGWENHAFLMVPFTGPSSDRGVVGSMMDRVTDPATYLSPLPYVFSYNTLAENMPLYEQFTASEADPYFLGKQAWAYLSDKKWEKEFDFTHESGAATQTLETILLVPKDPKFAAQRTTLSVRVPTTGKRLRYTFWMQSEPAPVVYFIPGLGGHRRSSASAAFAEMFFNGGFSVVTVSSVYNPEYIYNGSPSPLPGNSQADTEGLLRVLTRIDRQINIDFPNQITSKVLSGVSMGGFHTLYLAANQSRAREQELLVFDHYLAMDSPMDLLFSMRRLDQYFLEPLSWPSDSRREKIQDTMQKTLAVSQSSEFKHGELPYTAEEARYLIGLSFKISLRDLIYATQRRLNLGVLKNKIGYFKRDKVYDEIMEYSFMEYYKEFLMSYFSENHGDAQATEEDLRSFGTLETFEAGFKEKENWDLILNRNDFLLSGADLQWLLNEMPSKRLHIFSEGGHLGNLWKPEVQAEILARLNHLLVR